MPDTTDIQSMMEYVGGEETIELRLRRFEEDLRYMQSLWYELMKDYRDEWVAVYERSLVAHGRTASKLHRQLLAKKIPPSEAVIDFIASERKAMLL